mmetsp:Transcript_13144/g.15926  ORF Transcript_13144/g.15926 Transcript_13144/m.15926 type:complete len:97 (+) Transcript_13144:131-421(+)|eukprot:CAMPEP_0197850862 /NCGR_PEP_ID=MMETSP1438-20131217/16606_1 /TAXON_ID=1461541 /ORGANISM="Pterosperma sp., Strain CCMP1384" /LENGTH=96 /DNA_ID=CAMNT_0043464253 /DNA_START=130 /DNA_END=420 /DNA_ORIENTATION=+
MAAVAERPSEEVLRSQQEQQDVVETVSAAGMVKAFGQGPTPIELAAMKEREKQEKKAAKKAEREAKKEKKAEEEAMARGEIPGKKLSKKERKSLEG